MSSRKISLPRWALVGLCLLLWAVELAAVEKSAADPAASTPVQLQLIVEFGPQRIPLESAEMMAVYAHQCFRQRGYKGELKHVSREKAAPDANTLVLGVRSWTFDAFGTPECIIVASLFRNGAATELGEFRASEMVGGGKDPRAMLRQVAERPLHKLAEAIRARELLPGFVARKKKKA